MTPPPPDQKTDLTAKLRLSPEALATLKERANGHTLDEFVSSLLEAEMARPSSMDELLAPLRAGFVASGMSDEEIDSFLRNELEETRAARRATS